MADGRDGQPKTAFQQQNGWSLSPKQQRMRGRTSPGNLLGIAEQRNQFNINEDAPVSPGTKAPQNEQDNYFDSISSAGNLAAPPIPSSFPRDDQSSLSAVAPWEQHAPGPPNNPFPSNTTFGMYSEAWSGDQRPGTSRTQTSESFSTGDGGHKRSISDRFKQEASKHLRHNSSATKLGERSPLSSKKSSTASGGLRSRTMSTREATPPVPSRPKTPQASREVAPWDYQESGHDLHYSTPPRQAPPPMPELTRIESLSSETSQGPRRGVFGHRQRNSRDEGRSLRSQHSAADLSDRSRLSSKQSRTNLNPFSRRQTETLKPNVTSHPDMPRLETRATSPVGSIRSAIQASQADGSASAGSSKKPGILGRIGRHLHLGDKPEGDEQNMSAQTSSPAHTVSPASILRNGFNDPSGLLSQPGPQDAINFTRHDSVATTMQPISRKDSALPKKEGGKGRLFHRDRTNTNKRSGASDEGGRGDRSNAVESGVLYELDKDLGNMEGIVDSQSQPPDLNLVQGPGGSYFEGQGVGPQFNLEAPMVVKSATWEVPDSWHVKNGPNEKPEASEESDIELDPEASNKSFCIRVFRVDGTFATLALPLNSTVNEILKLLGKKSFLQDDLDNYQIVMRKGELQRELGSTERPIVMQKRLLERAGYTASDHIEQEGQDDNSYLCSFTFVGVKVSGYYSLDKEGNFEFERMTKFSNIDLSGRSLVTIPIVLYKKSSEIVSLNLSRNLALDVPRDFVASCSHLKEIRYTGNEARSLPPSFSLASNLQVLDVSHNQIEQLETADLGRLQNLCSLKVANNRLSELPLHFTQFKQLRSLNLSSNNFKKLPSFFGQLTGLVDLDISFNALESWPPVEDLDSLERFWATNNQLHGSVPDEYRNLTTLKDIDIRFNGVSNIDVVARLPNVEQLLVGHNSIAHFEGFFPKLRVLQIDHNPITKFDITSLMPSLSSLNLASNKLNDIDPSVYEKLPNLTRLNLDTNHIANLSVNIGRLSRLEVLTIAKNPLMTFPNTIGCLQELRKIDARECNIKRLPPEIWFCSKLEELNLAANVLDDFPRLTQSTQPPVVDPLSVKSSTSLQANFMLPQSPDDAGVNGDDRRPSQASSSMMSYGSSPAASTRKNSVMSSNTATPVNGRKPSMPSRQGADVTPLGHKDSTLNARMASTFAGSLRSLCLAANRLGDEVFDSIALLSDLRVLNLSYNEINDIPSNVLSRWTNLQELYVSGNDLASLPTEDFEHITSLKVLFLNGNKFQTLPAELSSAHRLHSFDVGCNILKYNVANVPYDWNWVYNPNLRYLNFSGNRRLEIRPVPGPLGMGSGPQGRDLTSFNSLQSLRILGLIDVTLTIPHVPDETDDRRVRTTGSALGGLRYGMADSLGKLEHLSILDLMVDKFRGHDSEYLVGMFDGQTVSSGGSRVARFLQENFKYYFAQQMAELMPGEDASDALRRSFLTMNKDLITFTTSNWEQTQVRLKQTPIKHAGSAHALTPDDRTCGGVATVLFIQDMELFVANVGNAQAILIPNDGSFKILTEKHEPAHPEERQRIRDAGGYVSRYGKLNDSLDVSRAFGYAQHVPAVMAAPKVLRVSLRDVDEMVLVASKEFWDYVTADFAIDLARSERADTMRAAQRLRDLAIAFGASSKIMVMVVGVSHLKKSSRNQDGITHNKRTRRPRDGPDDTRLALLDREVDAPIGEVALVFTDIKSSTALWEKVPIAMRSAIRIHNELMRRQLRIIGGYEVKTEGDAFMIAFPTTSSALLWCFSVQNQLLVQPWPTEVLDSVHGEELQDDDGNVIYRGLSVRMGIHWGAPVCEPDPITRRMDYFGPIVNRAARIQGVADGGEITCSGDFISEFERSLELYADPNNYTASRGGSNASEETVFDDSMGESIRKDLKALGEQGFEVKDMGERKLKGIENPEILFQIYPHSLAGRQQLAESKREAEANEMATAAGRTEQDEIKPGSLQQNTKLNIEPQHIWSIWEASLHLEMLCSSLEDPSVGHLKSPETAIMERMRSQGGEVTDRVLVQFMEHLICRIETCVNTLTLRNLVRPFGNAESLFDVAGPIQGIFKQLADDMKELEQYRKEKGLQISGA